MHCCTELTTRYPTLTQGIGPNQIEPRVWLWLVGGWQLPDRVAVPIQGQHILNQCGARDRLLAGHQYPRLDLRNIPPFPIDSNGGPGPDSQALSALGVGLVRHDRRNLRDCQRGHFRGELCGRDQFAR